MIKELAAFTHGQIQDAVNILKIIEQKSLTEDDLKKHIEEMAFSPKQKMSRRGFLKRTTLTERGLMRSQKGLTKQPCVRCDEKRRGKK